MYPLGILDSHNQKETIVILRDSIFKEINLFDEFKTQIKREPTSNEAVRFVVEKGARLIAPTTKPSAILVDDRWTVNNKLTLVNEGFILGKWGVNGNDGTLNKAYCSKNSARGYSRSETMLTAYFDIPIDHNMEWHKAPPGKGGVAGKIYTGNVVIDSKSRGYLAGYLPSGEYKPNNIPDWLANRAESWNKQGDLLTK